MLNYEIAEKIHTSSMWNNVILKVKGKGISITKKILNLLCGKR